jgi:hypothetical protein
VFMSGNVYSRIQRQTRWGYAVIILLLVIAVIW